MNENVPSWILTFCCFFKILHYLYFSKDTHGNRNASPLQLFIAHNFTETQKIGSTDLKCPALQSHHCSSYYFIKGAESVKKVYFYYKVYFFPKEHQKDMLVAFLPFYVDFDLHHGHSGSSAQHKTFPCY